MESQPSHPSNEYKGQKKVQNMNFSEAGNGLRSDTHFKTFRGGQGGGPSHDFHSESMNHPTGAHAVKHFKKTFPHMFGQQPMPEEPAKTMPHVKAAPDPKGTLDGDETGY